MAHDELRLDEFLPYRLSVAANAVSQVIASAFEERYGLKSQEWRVIAVLAEDGERTQQGIVARTNMDKVTVSRAAHSLVEKGLVRRVTDPADARSRRLSLTAAGRRLYGKVAPEVLRLETRVLEGLGAREVERLHQTLRKIQQAAEAILAE